MFLACLHLLDVADLMVGALCVAGEWHFKARGWKPDFEGPKIAIFFMRLSPATLHGGYFLLMGQRHRTTQSFAILNAAFEFEHSISKTSIFKSCQISILSAAIDRTTQRVDQICPQIKNLIFLEIGCVGCGSFKVRLSSPALDVSI